MATIMGARPSPAAASAVESASPDEQPMSDVRPTASRATKNARGASAASKPVKASKTKTPNGANSDHRKEQNRIASRNYREKRKHKLALLQQILHEPSASEGASAAKAASASASASASTPTSAPTFSTAAAAASVAQDVDTLGGILPDFQPILSGLMPANMLAPGGLDGSSATTPTPSIPIPLVAPPPSSSSTVPVPTQTPEPLDEFAVWAASNLPAAVAANSPRSQRLASPSSASASGSRSGSAPRSTSTSTPIPALSSSSAAATASDLLDMPMLQPWLIPFSSDQNIFTPFLTNTTLNNAVTAANTSASTTSASAGRPVTEVVDLDETFDPAIDVDQFMSDSQQQNANADNLFSDLMMRADFSTSYFATQSYHNLQGTFGSSTTGAAAAVGSSIPLPFAPSSPSPHNQNNTHRQQPTPRPHTTTLPSRPSPRPFFQTLASPSDTTSASTGPPPNFLPYTIASPTATGDMAREPSRKTRKKNKPVVRAMLQYVQTLSPHQKRLILQALLDGEGGAPGDEGGGDDNDNEMGDDNDDERIEEIDNGEDDSDGSNGGRSNKSNGSADKAAAKKAAFISRREERRRQVVARWNSGRVSAETGDRVTGFSFSSSSSSSSSSGSPSSGASTIEATNFANMALSSGFDGPNGLTGPIHHGQPPNGIYGANFGAEPGARPYFPVPLMVMNLQCRRMGFRAVVLENCLACGLINPDLMFDESACYDEELEPASPFALNADEARAVVLQGAGRIAAVVAAVRQGLARAGKTPPRDLQPVDAQILVAHHPYIDIIPFKGFRARVLALLAEMELAEEVAAAVQKNNNADGVVDTPPGGGRGNETPCLLDEDELCYDMNVAEGLVCWGSQVGNAGAGMSAQAKRDSDSSRDMRACLPWDMRSWEPQVWFLKKYWFLVGGWDDDMWRNCRWWHSMRGDDLDYSVFASPGY